MAKPVLIVGGGLAGLVCARTLHNAGVPFLLLDAEDRPGGRLKTDIVDGFRLDRGFQVYFDAYPNASAQLDHAALDLRPFRSGAQIFHGGALNLIDQKKPLAMLLSRFLPPKDKLKLHQMMGTLSESEVGGIRIMADMTAEEHLQGLGFSETFMERFAHPFFGSVFLDRSLQVSRRQLLFVWKMLVDGNANLPAKGIEEIPKQIVADLPRYALREFSKVAEVLRENGRAVGVRLDTNERFEGSAVVIATEADAAARLSGLPTVEGRKSSTCLYFDSPHRIVEGAYLVLNASGSGRVSHVAPITNVAPDYCPSGKHLVAVTVLGEDPMDDEALAEEVRREMTEWFPQAIPLRWRFLRAYRVPYAQMPQPVGGHAQLPENETRLPGLYFAGEFTTNASIDGAVESAVRCANLILEREHAAVAA